jgi:hypothetical protein
MMMDLSPRDEIREYHEDGSYTLIAVLPFGTVKNTSVSIFA